MAIERYRAKIETELRRFVEQMGEKNELRDGCEYALLNGGKRLRPILVLMIAEALGEQDVMPAAMSVELFHTASLIADDLPCMDNDDLRRNRPSLHKAYGESIAILASYALIAEGYGGIHRNSRLNPSADANVCLEAATRCAGLSGATGGQYLDLYPPDSSLETIKKILFLKTGTLFEICFVFGWVFGGGALTHLPQVRRCAYHLGLAFQIGDDLLDDAQDAASMNIAAVCGREEAFRLFEEEMIAFTTCLKELNLWTEPFQQVVQWLQNYPNLNSSGDFQRLFR